MKRILALLTAAILLLVMLGGCMGRTSAETLATLSEEEVSAPSGSYSADLSGLCKYMEDGGAVVADGENYPTETNYGEIGATAGQRYRFRYNGSTVQVEFYEYDPENLSDVAQSTLADAQVQGQITVLNNTVTAAASGDNRFLMLYVDAKNDEKNQTHQADVKVLFEKFCASHQ